MFLFALAFLSGDLFLQNFSYLPGKIPCSLSLTLLFILWFWAKKYIQYSYLPLFFFLGFTWSVWYASSVLSFALPKELEGKPLKIKGYIASIVTQNNGQQRFDFYLQEIISSDKNIKTKAYIKLSTQDDKMHMKPGEKWSFIARLKRIHSTQNPSTFDFEAWGLQNNLRANGYVVTSKENQLLAYHWYYFPIAQLRQALKNKIQLHLPQTPTAVWLQALMIGERESIPQAYWQVLKNTGTNHLMAIAGLHIGLLAGFTHFIFSRIWRLFPALLLVLPAQEAGVIAALMCAFIYGLLAGFSLPTQRALIMLAVFSFAVLLRGKISAWRAWSFALLCVLLFNPLSVLTESFWLSFATIALIIYGMSHRLHPAGWWWKWGRVQWVIGVGLTPLTFLLFQQCSLISFIANSIAIPWLGFLILPFCFLATIVVFIFPPATTCLLFLADKSLTILWAILTAFSQVKFSTWHQAIPTQTIFFCTSGAFLFLLLPTGTPGRWLGIYWLLPFLFYQPPQPAEGDIWFSLLDVGQGLAIVVQTKTHTLIYDTGPKYATGMDMGESVVVPYLYSQGLKKIDMLVVSHGDNDHAGGVNAVLKSFPVKSIKTSVPDAIASSLTDYCSAGESWQWDGVNFTFLYPTTDDLGYGNDSSCVLRVDNGDKSLLLTGDIEKFAENNLISRVPKLLPATILVAPHHGSKTSSIKKFVAAVHPDFVLYATGYRNRYHFPHKNVIAEYNKINVTQLNTVETGMMFFRIEKQKKLSPILYRLIHSRYWYD